MKSRKDEDGEEQEALIWPPTIGAGHHVVLLINSMAYWNDLTLMRRVHGVHESDEIKDGKYSLAYLSLRILSR